MVEHKKMSRTFKSFPRDKACPLCGDSRDMECTLVQIQGTEDGTICQAMPVHVACLSDQKYWLVNKGFGVIYARIYP